MLLCLYLWDNRLDIYSPERCYSLSLNKRIPGYEGRILSDPCLFIFEAEVEKKLHILTVSVSKPYLTQFTLHDTHFFHFGSCKTYTFSINNDINFRRLINFRLFSAIVFGKVQNIKYWTEIAISDATPWRECLRIRVVSHTVCPRSLVPHFRSVMKIPYRTTLK
jgi:hypothetical protein